MVDKIIQKENNIKMQVKNLNFYYEANQVLKNINLIVKSNAVTAIIGPSGCGKSTFIRTLNRMNDIISGTKIEGDILFNHKDIYAEDIDVVEIRRKIGMVFQRPNPFPKSIFENVAYGLKINGLIKNKDDLDAYLQVAGPAYIQEYLPTDRDIRVVVIGKKIVHSYWRIASEGEFRSNVALGGIVSLDPVPAEALDLALHTAKICQWDDVGIDICRYNKKFYVLEANMKYGKEGFRKAGIDYKELMETMIDNEEI